MHDLADRKYISFLSPRAKSLLLGDANAELDPESFAEEAQERHGATPNLADAVQENITAMPYTVEISVPDRTWLMLDHCPELVIL